MTQKDNLAYALRSFDTEEQQDKQPRIRQLEKTQTAAKPKKIGKSLFCLGYIVVLCGALMFAKVQLTEENNAMLQARSDLEELQSISAQLNLESESLSSSLFCLGYVVLLCGALMFAKVQLTEENNAMLQAQNDLEELQSISAQLNLESESLSSLKSIEDAATNEYGLVEPDSSQVNCIRVKKPNKVEVTDSEKSILDQAAGWLEQIKEYILG